MYSSVDRSSGTAQSINLRYAIAAVLALSAAAVSQVRAQEAASEAAEDASKAKTDEVVDLSDVSVTEDPLRALSNQPSGSSFGFSKPLLETPRSVTFVSEEQIRLFGVSSTEDLTRLVPGTYTTTRYGLQGAVNVRTVSADMYYRGMKRLTQQGHVRSVLSAYDNIEVVKGPPSPLYGMGRIGGYLVLDPKASRAKTGKYMTKDQGYLQGTYGSYKKSEIQFGEGLPFTIGDRPAGVYIVGLLEDSNTFVKHVGAQQRFLQTTMSVDNAIGPFRLEIGGQLQNSITSGAYMNRVTQNLIDNGVYISGQPMAKLDLNNDGRVGYVETYLASPVTGSISGNNQALNQRYVWKTDSDGNPLPLSQYANSITGIPQSFKTYLQSHPEISCPVANYMRSSAVPVMTLGTNSSGSLVTRNMPVGFFLNPCTVTSTQVDYRGNGAYEREQNATQRMGYFDLIYDTNPDFTVKNQLFYDSIDSFKDSWLPYGERQYIKAIENKITVTRRVPGEWLPGWLAVNTLGSINYRETSGYIKSSGGDFDHRQDVMFSSGADGSGTAGYYPNTMFWTQLTNASYATGTPASTWRISQYSETGAGVLFDIDLFRKTNLTLGGRYDRTRAVAKDEQLFNPNTGTVTVTQDLIDQYINGTACQTPTAGCPGGSSPALRVSGSDTGASWSISLSHQLPWNIRPYFTAASSSLSLDGSNNLFATGTVSGGKLIGDAFLREVGVKGTLFGGRVQWVVDAFRQSRNDVSSPSDPSVGVEVTSTETNGAEVEIKFAPTKSLYASASVSYMKSEYVVGASNTNIDVNARDLGFQDIVDPATGQVYPAEAFGYGGRIQLVLNDPNNVYKDVPGVPNWQGAVNLTYQLPANFGVVFGAQYFSESWANRIKTEVLPGATVYDLGGTWERGNFHLKLSGYNILDKRYFRAGSGGNSQLVSVMPGHRWEVSMKVDF